MKSSSTGSSGRLSPGSTTLNRGDTCSSNRSAPRAKLTSKSNSMFSASTIASKASEGKVVKIHNSRSSLSVKGNSKRVSNRSRNQSPFWTFAKAVARSQADEFAAVEVDELPVERNSMIGKCEAGGDALCRLVSNSSNRTNGLVERVGNEYSKHTPETPVDVLVRAALEEEWQVVSCASLPITVLFFILFMVLWQQYYKTTNIYFAEKPFRKMLGEPAEELSRPLEVYAWLQEHYFPFMWGARPLTQTNASEVIDTPALFQELIGGVTLITTRARIHPCEDAFVQNVTCYNGQAVGEGGDAFAGLDLQVADAGLALEDAGGGRRTLDSTRISHTPKASSSGVSVSPPPGAATRARRRVWSRRRTAWGEERSTASLRGSAAPPRRRRRNRRLRWARRLRLTRPELKNTVPSQSDGRASRMVIPAVLSVDDVDGLVARAHEAKVISEATLTFTAHASVLNSNLNGMQLLSNVEIIFSFNRAGSVSSETRIITLVLNTIGEDSILMIIAPCWVVCLSAFTLILSIRSVVKFTQGQFLQQILRFWSLMEWAIVVCGWIILFAFITELNHIQAIKVKLQDYRLSMEAAAGQNISASQIRTVDNLFPATASACELDANIQSWVCFYHILLVFRYFLAVRGQPRLALVLNTIRKASVDLAHLLMVFLMIFFGFAVTGHLIFGRRMEEYSTIQGAAADCLEIVMEREYPWDKFTEIDLYTSSGWVLTFLILVVLVLVNVFLAILFASYQQVRASVGDGSTVWQTTKHLGAQVHNAVRSVGQNTRWVSNRELIDALARMQAEMIAPWMLKDAVPGISNKQVNYIFNLANDTFERLLMQSSTSTLPEVMASVLLGLERMYDGMGRTNLPGQHKAVSSPTRFRAETKLVEPDLSIALAADDFKVERPPDEAPPWVRMKLLPHFQKQAILQSQLRGQVQMIDRSTQYISRAGKSPLTELNFDEFDVAPDGAPHARLPHVFGPTPAPCAGMSPRAGALRFAARTIEASGLSGSFAPTEACSGPSAVNSRSSGPSAIISHSGNRVTSLLEAGGYNTFSRSPSFPRVGSGMAVVVGAGGGEPEPLPSGSCAWSCH